MGHCTLQRLSTRLLSNEITSEVTYRKDACGFARNPACFVHIIQQVCEQHPRNVLQTLGFTGDTFLNRKGLPLSSTLARFLKMSDPVLLPMLQHSWGGGIFEGSCGHFSNHYVILTPLNKKKKLIFENHRQEDILILIFQDY